MLEGHVRFVCGGQWLDAGPGTSVYAPRETPHGFKVVGPQAARMLFLCAPAGFEKFVLELCIPIGAVPAQPDMAKLMAAAASFHIDILGPLPRARRARQTPARRRLWPSAGDLRPASGT